MAIIPSSISSLTLFISLLFLSHTVNSLSFKFHSFDSYDKFIAFQGDAFASQGRLHLTKSIHGVPLPNSAGRASYASPVHLWDSRTGKVAAFTTSFSFIVSPSSSSYSTLLGDGFSFFIAPFSADMPSNSSGGFLGLFSASTALNSYANNQIVAVEFDTFGNPWDPTSSAHIGIDVNSIASVKTSSWNVEEGLIGIATISYDPSKKRLSVYVSYPESKGKQRSSSSLSAYVDLTSVLPPWVRVGFSGATGEVVELHNILAWQFISSDLY
ncbi:hypothetical protein QN277_028520 [Acacia crassicarpa]|uniref:Legume lectin domain-containing protein n=1 Tax=Acacia crassicarpa TaxID=499986 RepID=A0AAE1J4Z7_9FABA|nr:hypothetical protein QN277_028520 [Acacia crassicarpa]